MTPVPTRTPSRADHKRALEACRWCRVCTEELDALRDMWEAQSRTIADQQRRLANATYGKSNVGPRAPRG